MVLAPGARIGAYEVVSQIGSGGMGEVYLARDTALNRNVALKVLPEAFVRDDERLARFKREAQILASLNHPNIAHVHGLEESSATRALVMELVEGDDLSVRIARGPIPLADALPIARQIADALETAHDQGIVHRDLKPANIKVKADGTVKVLDFGLAKALTQDSGVRTDDISDSPTLTARATEQGVILGTAAYMAPEQARGKAVDKRADIWAFGVVLYEMLTGARAFDGRGFTDVLAAVLRTEIDWSRLPGDTPAPLRQLLARCVEPDVKQRLRDIGEARIAIVTIERGHPDSAADARAAATPHRPWRERLAWSLAAIAVLAAVTIVVWQRSTLGRLAASAAAGNEVVRLSVLPPLGFLMNPDSTNVAISPNGRMVAFVVGTGVSTENQLWVRPIEAMEARRIEAGDGASLPFWSPDSERIGFFASRKLKTVAASGGPAMVVCDAPFGRGASWNASNVIVFAPDADGPLLRVAASGGPVAAATTLDAGKSETGHRFPVFLPDGDHFLFAALPRADGMVQIFAGALHDPLARTFVGAMENAPVYAAPGWLLFTRQGVLAAQAFDVRTLRVSGEAMSLGDQPAVAPGPAAYDAGRRVSASASGSLAYFLQPVANTTVQWMDQTGKTTGSVNVPSGRYSEVAIAPDSTKAVLVRSDSSTSSSLWLVDLMRAGAIPLSMGGITNPSPVWSPDSTRIVFAGLRDGQPALYEKTVTEASAEPTILPIDGIFTLPRGWSKDQAWIVANRLDPGTKWNIYRIQVSGAAAPVPVVQGPAIEVGGWPSPDNRWLAYLSDETGSLDLFVQPFPNPGPKVQVTTSGIQQAWWTPDARHLLYTKRDQTLWRVDVDLRTAVPRIDAPVQLAAFPSTLVGLDLARDGRFLALVSERSGLGTVTVVQSWQAALPAGR